MKWYFLVVALLISSHSMAQIDLCKPGQKKDKGRVSLFHSDNLETMFKNQLAANEKEPVIIGYRVQIYFGSDRSEALDLRSKFLQQYSSHGAYLSYDQPYFRIRVGDFRSRMEAQKLMQELKGKFESLIIITEQINPEKLERQ
jgi:hypothetical protein